MQHSVGISTVTFVVFRTRRTPRDTETRAVETLSENMTSLTTPEVRNVSQRRQNKTEPRLQATCVEIGESRPCGFRVMSVDRQNRQTDRHTHRNAVHPLRGGGRSNDPFSMSL